MILMIVLFLFAVFPFVFLGDEKCQGKSDVYFLLDASGSVWNSQWLQFMRACRSIVDGFDNVGEDGVRVSIGYFASKSEITIPLTGDKQKMYDQFDHWSEGCPTQGSYPDIKYDRPWQDRNEPGFYLLCKNRPTGGTEPVEILDLIDKDLENNDRPDVPKFIFFFTDGEPNGDCCKFMGDNEDYTIPFGSYKGTVIEKHSNGNCRRKSDQNVHNRWCTNGGLPHMVDKLKSKHKMWFVPIQIRNSVDNYMMEYLASYDCLYYFIKEFSDSAFNPLVDQFKKLTCLDVFGMEPVYGCQEPHNISVSGAGFMQSTSKKEFCNLPTEAHKLYCKEECSGLQMKCRYKKENDQIEVVNAEFIGENDVICPLNTDESEPLGKIEVEISLDGDFYTQREHHFEIVNCTADQDYIPSTTDCYCKGVTDLIFVLDSSYSVDDDEFKQLQEFVYTLLNSVCIHDEVTKVSIIQFTTTQKEYYNVNFNLTGNKNHVMRTVRNMGRLGKGGTPLHSGLKAAYEQILNNGRPEAYKFVVVVSDGVTDSCTGINVDKDCITPSIEQNTCTDQYEACFTTTGNRTCYWDIINNSPNMKTCCNCDQEWINNIKQEGAFVFGVAVGNSNNTKDDLDVEYIKNYISSKPEYYAHANSYSEINNLISKIANSTCIDVFYSDPGALCYGDDIEMQIIGTGFSQNTATLVRFYHPYDNGYKDYFAQFISSKRLKLSIPMTVENLAHFKQPDIYKYSVSMGGKFWSDEKVFRYDYTAATCQTRIDIVPIVAGTTLFILGFLLILAIILLLSLFMCGLKRKPVVAKAVELQEEELEEPAPLPEVLPEPEPEPIPFIPPPKVKRSMYYVGGKAMSVDWGEKGMTWDSPFRGNNMGMGDNYGHTKKNKLYEEIQRRKKERLRRQQAAQNAGSKPNVNRSAKPKINRGAKPQINRAKKPTRPARPARV